MTKETAIRMGDEMLAMLRHATGEGKFNRNTYCVAMDSEDGHWWWFMVGMGLAKAGPTINAGRDQYFSVTPAGIEFLKNWRRP